MQSIESYAGGNLGFLISKVCWMSVSKERKSHLFFIYVPYCSASWTVSGVNDLKHLL
jgi:hypothetical protein